MAVVSEKFRRQRVGIQQTAEGMIRHASVYDRVDRDRQPADEGYRVLVMRQWPRGVRRDRTDLWLKEAGPSRELLHAYNHADLGWDEFERRYRAEMLGERATVLEQLRDLEREHGLVTLLCHERIPPSPHCHREVLADLLATLPPTVETGADGESTLREW